MLADAVFACPLVCFQESDHCSLSRLFSLCPAAPSPLCSWTSSLTVKSAVAHATSNEETLKTLLDLAAQYHKRLEEAEGKTVEELVVANVVGAAERRENV